MPVEGIEELAALARDLRAAGDKGLTKELRAGCQRAIKPLKEVARQAALDGLPSEGGLAAEVAASRFTGRVSLLGRNPRITMEGKGRKNDSGKEHDLRAMDRGRLRHPTHGRGNWVTQLIPPLWWSAPMEEGAGVVRPELLKAAEAVLDKLGRG